MRVADLIDRHPGRVAYILGTGPGLDAFICADGWGARANKEGIVIALNRSIGVCPRPAGRTYWVVQDDAIGRGEPGPWGEWTDQIVAGNGITALMMDPLYGPSNTWTAAPVGDNIIPFRRPGSGHRDQVLADPIGAARIGELYVENGTACTAVHAAHVMGCSVCIFVGCDGGNERAQCLQQWYLSPRARGFGYVPARDCAEKVAAKIGIPYIYAEGVAK